MLLSLIVHIWLVFIVSGSSQPNKAVYQVEQANIGSRLDGRMIVELSGDDLVLNKCALLCIQLTSCKSINFARVPKICQLNAATKAEVELAHFHANNTFVYIDIALWPTQDSDACFTKPCTGNDRCFATVASGGSHECYSTDCMDPLNLVNGSTIATGSNAIGSIRRYVCPAGQMPQGTNTITCSFSGWSTPSFTCEYVRSCSDIQTCDPSYTDDEYWLYPAPYGNTSTKVYCDSLSESTPKEYISDESYCLMARAVWNFRGSGYKRKIIYEPICTVSSSENYAYDSFNSVTRYFNKIRVDIEAMIVDRDDKTFTTATGSGFDLKYGYGIGCQCPFCTSSYFKIDTSGTGLIFDPSLTWRYDGISAKMLNFARANGGTVISANCGGHCGYCEADGSMTLQLNPNDDVAEEEAIRPVCMG